MMSNPFLDPEVEISRGKLSIAGEPLRTLILPDISTLISTTENQKEDLITVKLINSFAEQIVVEEEEKPIKNDLVGFELNFDFYDTADLNPGSSMSQINQASLGKTLGNVLPTTMREALNVLHLITPRRKGAANESFGIHELRTIAKSLNIPSNGNKDVLAMRITKTVTEFFNITMD